MTLRLNGLIGSEVDQKRGHIEVKARKAKSARRRIVQMQTNLATWLQPYAGMTGAVAAVNWRKKLDLVRKAAKLARWPQNGLRHSFASYRLGATHDAPRVASELGHTSPKMLYSTYRELVLPEEAERYWKLAPEVPVEFQYGLRTWLSRQPRRMGASYGSSREALNAYRPGVGRARGVGRGGGVDLGRGISISLAVGFGVTIGFCLIRQSSASPIVSFH